MRFLGNNRMPHNLAVNPDAPVRITNLASRSGGAPVTLFR
jgi:hypothetical protein